METNRNASWKASVVLCIISLVGCDFDDKPPPLDTTGLLCSSQQWWLDGDKESPLMHPGTDCNTCHTDKGEGPKLSVYGTVFGATDDHDDCFGVNGVTVEVTDADGKVHSLATNTAGNFFLEERRAGIIKAPYTVRIIQGDIERVMVSPQTDINCNSCHTATGANGAPGRIVL